MIGEYWIKHKNNTNMNYEEAYGGFDYTGMTILDIGAAFHTPDFFLDKGAKRVIAVDCDEERMNAIIDYANKLNKNNTDMPMIYHVTKLTDPFQIKSLYTGYQPDVVKIDCEGCEALLLRLSKDIIGIPKIYVMETHTHHHPRNRHFKNHYIINLHSKLVRTLELTGYNILVDNIDNKFCGSIKASRI